MDLDQFTPTFDRRLVRTTIVDAPALAVYGAIFQADVWRDAFIRVAALCWGLISPGVAMLMWRGLALVKAEADRKPKIDRPGGGA